MVYDNNHKKDPIICMVHAVLNDNKDMNPDNSIVIKTKKKNSIS